MRPCRAVEDIVERGVRRDRGKRRTIEEPVYEIMMELRIFIALAIAFEYIRIMVLLLGKVHCIEARLTYQSYANE